MKKYRSISHKFPARGTSHLEGKRTLRGWGRLEARQSWWHADERGSDLTDKQTLVTRHMFNLMLSDEQCSDKLSG